MNLGAEIVAHHSANSVGSKVVVSYSTTLGHRGDGQKAWQSSYGITAHYVTRLGQPVVRRLTLSQLLARPCPARDHSPRDRPRAALDWAACQSTPTGSLPPSVMPPSCTPVSSAKERTSPT